MIVSLQWNIDLVTNAISLQWVNEDSSEYLLHKLTKKLHCVARYVTDFVHRQARHYFLHSRNGTLLRRRSRAVQCQVPVPNRNYQLRIRAHRLSRLSFPIPPKKTLDSSIGIITIFTYTLITELTDFITILILVQFGRYSRLLFVACILELRIYRLPISSCHLREVNPPSPDRNNQGPFRSLGRHSDTVRMKYLQWRT